jgi:hypothetical protein
MKNETVWQVPFRPCPNAPDCGAYESGQKLLLSGPRPQGIDETSQVFEPQYRPMHNGILMNNGWPVAVISRNLIYTVVVKTPGKFRLSLLDASGRMISVQSYTNRISGIYKQKMSIRVLPAGCYVARLQSLSYRLTNKFFIGL